MGLLDGLFATPSDQALWALGSGLLGVRRGNEGRAMLGAMGAYNQAQQEQRRNRLTDAQILKTERDLQDPQMFGKLDPSDFTPASLAKFQVTKNYGDLELNPRNLKAPSSVLEFQFLKDLKDPQDIADFWGIKRAPMVKDIGGIPTQVGPQGIIPLSTLSREAQARGIKKATETQAAGAAQAGLDLAAAETQIPLLEKQVKELLAHPGRKWGTGMLGMVPAIPNTPQGDFVNRFNNLKSKSFLAAFETLKGGGQITEIEGAKATEAMNRMNRATTDQEFEAAAADFIESYKAGVAKLKAKARQFPSGYMGGSDQARGVRGYGMTEPVDRVPDSDPLGIR